MFHVEHSLKKYGQMFHVEHLVRLLNYYTVINTEK